MCPVRFRALGSVGDNLQKFRSRLLATFEAGVENPFAQKRRSGIRLTGTGRKPVVRVAKRLLLSV